MALLTHAEAVTKLAEFLKRLGLPQEEDAIAEARRMLPAVEFAKHIGNPDLVHNDPDVEAATQEPKGWISRLLLVPPQKVYDEILSVSLKVNRLEQLQVTLRSRKPRLEALWLYERLHEADLSLSFFQGVSLVLKKVLTTESEQRGWLCMYLASVLYPDQEIDSTMAKLINLLISVDPRKLDPDFFPSILDFASELTPDGVVHALYSEHGSLRNVNLLTWMLKLLSRRGSAFPVVKQIAQKLGYTLGIIYQTDYEEFLAKSNLTDWDIMQMLVINELRACRGENGIRSFFS